QNLSQKLLQKLSPQQIQFIKLLQLNTLDLEQRIEQELVDNPALEPGKDEDPEFGANDELDLKNDDLDTETDAEDDLYSSDDLYDISDYTDGADDSDSFRLYEDSGGDEEKKEMPVATSSSFLENLMNQI